LTTATESADLVSLGTVFHEPVWIFVRGTQTLEPGSGGFKGRVSVGESGSGTRALTTALLSSIGQDLSHVEVVDLSNADAGEALLRGELDLAMMVSGWEAPIVRRLLIAPGITTMAAPRSDAQVALRPYLSKLVLPRGVADLISDRPPADVQLMATKASLLVRRDLHPAIQYLLLDSAAETHGAPGIFHRAGQFPAAEPMDLPLSEAARQYYRSGVPWLQRNLPFWLASLAAQALVLLVPIVGVIYPLFRLLPALYGWIMRGRIFHLYGELKLIEAELEMRSVDKVGPDLSAKLDQLEERANHMRVPKAFTHMLYTLRLHIEIVRKRIANAGT
jgi:NMT1-like family